VTMTVVAAETAAAAAAAEAAAAGSVDLEALTTKAEAMAAYTAPEETPEMMEQEILEAAARAGTTTAEPVAAVEAAAAMEMTAGAASAMTGVAAAAALALASRRDLKKLRPTFQFA